MQLRIGLLYDRDPQLVGIFAPSEDEVSIRGKNGKPVVHHYIHEGTVLVEDAHEDTILPELIAPPEALLQKLFVRGQDG
jgi:hypothetical protein